MVSGAAKRWGSISAAVTSYWYKTRSCQPHWSPCPLPSPPLPPLRPRTNEQAKNKIEVYESGQGRRGKSDSSPRSFSFSLFLSLVSLQVICSNQSASSTSCRLQARRGPIVTTASFKVRLEEACCHTPEGAMLKHHLVYFRIRKETVLHEKCSLGMSPQMSQLRLTLFTASANI